MKFSDLVASLFLALILAWLLFKTEVFIRLTSTYPYQIGFLKIGLLGTFGECLRQRLSEGRWLPNKTIIRFLVWGIFGLWFTAAFPFVDQGVKGLTNLDLWWFKYPALANSLWLNVLCGFGPFMMFIHYWIDCMLKNGLIAPWEILGLRETRYWGKVVFWSVGFFWIPAQAINFSLPPVWRILGAGVLAIILGLILSFASNQGQHDTKISV
jgi:hypothetical protein